MKKILYTILTIITLLFATQLTFADTDNVTDDELGISTQELEILSDSTGAEIRLLQLKKRIEIQIENANLILDTMNETDVEVEETIAELENLLAMIEETDFNKTADLLAQDFVAIKAQAIQSSKQFKEQTQTKLSSEEKNQLKEEIKVQTQNRLNAKDEKVEELKNQYNAKKTREMLKNFGLENEQLAQKVENGELTSTQAKEELMNQFKNMTQEQKKEATLKVKEQQQKSKVQAKKNEDQIKASLEQKKEQIQNRYEEHKDALMAKVQEKRTMKLETKDPENQNFGGTGKK